MVRKELNYCTLIELKQMKTFRYVKTADINNSPGLLRRIFLLTEVILKEGIQNKPKEYLRLGNSISPDNIVIHDNFSEVEKMS
ncbi:hypothetical protein [Lederbergia citrea]|uniref:Uncharacterized protein n=1 Tax=Lederbergia citrea TaxID=2833581 RepID=A0A942UTF4_9BACI|nr:hypothetical protein [Lederbergia citrea]MBS4177872.1 hypothetical protein [Lederbergia citrea]MBS4204547.1 hypothetical protein [Lederbergia citrea]MBS4223609.1 hypothetical protein [Lederbergia citrea]